MEHVLNDANFTSKEWKPLPISLLNEYETSMQEETNKQHAQEIRKQIESYFNYSSFDASIEKITIGGIFTKFTFKCNPSLERRHILRMNDDMLEKFGNQGMYLTNIDESNHTFDLEIENETVQTFSLRDIYSSLTYLDEEKLLFGLGKTVEGCIAFVDLRQVEHVLINDTLGCGSTIFIQSIITTLLMRNSADDMKFVLIDSNTNSFRYFNDVPHLLEPITSDINETKRIIEKLHNELELRYDIFSKYHQRDIDEYNEDADSLELDKMPYIVVFINDLAPFIKHGDILSSIFGLMVRGKYAGINVIARTTCDIGRCLYNCFPTRIAFKTNGIGLINTEDEKHLFRYHDMLVKSRKVMDGRALRLQSCFVHRKEIERVVNYYRNVNSANGD